MPFGSLGAVFGRLGLGMSGSAGGGPFLLKVDSTSRILLAGGTSRLLITGVAPTVQGASGSPIGLLLSLTYP